MTFPFQLQQHHSVQGRLSEGSFVNFSADLDFFIVELQDGGDLASIHSLAENNFLEDFVKARPVMDSRGGER